MKDDYGVITTNSQLADILRPLQLKSYINWVPRAHKSKIGKIIKVPVQKIDKPDTHMTFDEAYNISRRVGLVCDANHQIIALDLDGTQLKHPDIKSLLASHPTYIENSPSNKPGHHRILYQLEDPTSKLQLKTKATIKYGQNEELELYSASRNYVTLTGNMHPDSADYISLMDTQTLTHTFSTFKRTTPPPSSSQGLTSLTNLTGLPDPEVWITRVPCDEYHPLVQKYLSKHSTIYHDYWLQGIMALHSTFNSINGLEYAHKWSQTSEDYDANELNTRWASLTSDRLYESITSRTYMFMFNECVIDWPFANKAGTPNKDEYSNTLAFMKYHELSLESDAITTAPFLNGPDYVLVPKYYYNMDEARSVSDTISHMAAIMTDHVREFNYSPKPNILAGHLTTLLERLRPRDYKNRLVMYLDTLPPYDPEEGDYLQLLGQDIIQRNPVFEHPNQEFHNLLIRKWMISLARTFWPQPFESSAEGMLILHGKARINKSSLGPRLLPRMFKHLHIQTHPSLSGKSRAGQNFKDYKAQVCSKLIVDYDEAERIFDHQVNTEADIKNEVTAMVDTFRPAWGKHQLEIPRKYSIYASTNEQRLEIPSEGQRRCWWLNVQYCDTYLLDNWPVDRMWKQIEYILKQRHSQAPWLLTNSEFQYLSSYLARHRKTNDIEEILLDTFQWDEEGYAYLREQAKTHTVQEMMMTNPKVLACLMGHTIKRSALKHALKRLCKHYTPIDFKIKQTPISEGILHRNNQDLFLVPPVRN